MKDTVISVESISKKYKIGVAQRYETLRDHLAAFSKRLWPNGTERPRERDDVIWALKNLSFQVNRGEVLGIVGRNGAGKSTLLKILTRITTPTEGCAEIRGRVGSLLEVGTGFHPELTGRENVYLNAAVLGMRKAEIDRKFDEIVAFSEVEKFIDTPVKRYSSGMYVRLAFAVAAHLEPEILLVDEVLAVGDVAFQRKCVGKMGDVSKEGRTILFVSHSMGTVKSLCSRTILLKNGEVALEGDTSDVVSAYLEEGLSQENSVVAFEDNPKTPLFIRRVAVTDENGVPTRRFHLSSQICVEIDYVAMRDVRQGMILFAVSRDGTFIFQSHDTDLQPEYLFLREAGAYRSRVPLPRRFLTAGSYTVTFVAAIGSKGEQGHDGHPSVLSFHVDEEDEDVVNKSYAGYRNMMVIAELDWRTEKISG